MAYVGDGNNMTHSLMYAAAKVGMNFAAATPEGYEPNAEVVANAKADAAETGATVTITHNPMEAVAGADVIVTDTWASMGQEAEHDARTAVFRPYQVNRALVDAADARCIVMHCLPAYRGEEITEDAAKAQCQYFKEFAQRLQSEIKVELEEMINNFVQNNAQGLLNEYRSRIADLAKDLDVGKIAVDPFELIAGNMGSGIDAAALGQEMVREKKVGEEWVENTDKAWWKPWTWFDKDGWYEDVYKNVVNGSQLAQRFFAPIQKQLMDGEDRAIRHAQKQMKEIKAAFNEKFKELDSVLDRKLQELKDCATDQIQTEKFLEETRQKLAWLEDIQLRVQSILEI